MARLVQARDEERISLLDAEEGVEFGGFGDRSSHHGHSHAGKSGHGHAHGKGHGKEHGAGGGGFDVKAAAFVVVGILTFVYCIGELGVAIYADSLSLLSDGFHNLSDVLSLVIGWWANRATKRAHSDEMTFGWARTELLGAMTNACFLLSLCLYIALEAIPRFIKPQHLEAPGLAIIITAGAGVLLNTIGTIVFAITGHGHSHSHGGGGHGHSHGGGHGHAAHDDEEEEHEEHHGHSHASGGHGHAHGGQALGEKKKKKKKKKRKRDLNVHAIFLHYLGDMILSLFVLCVGILLHFFPSEKNHWAVYLDPASSLVIVGIILYTTIPLVKQCSSILLQSTPGHIDVPALRRNVLAIDSVLAMHEVHVWQLVDGMVIGSCHVVVMEGEPLNDVLEHVKRCFHDAGIHSASVQPEMHIANLPIGEHCPMPCTPECEEDKCCSKKEEKSAAAAGHGHAH